MTLRCATIGAITFAACSSVAQAQTIHVSDIIAVAGETDPRRFSEPHLAIHPLNLNQFLAAVFISSTAGTLQEMNADRAGAGDPHISELVLRPGIRRTTRLDGPNGRAATDRRLSIVKPV